MEKYKCKICNKAVEILKTHLNNQHKDLTLQSYLKLYNEEINYNKYMEDSKLERQKKSPNSIYFYLNKGFNVDDAKTELYKHNLNNPFRRLDVSPAQPKYWLKKGFSEAESIERSRLHNSNSLDSLIIKYGNIEGTKKYNNIQESFKGRKETIINRISLNDNVSVIDAICIYNEKMRVMSPKSLDYWINKGYTADEAKEHMKIIGQNTSPRHINYWLLKTNNNLKVAENLLYEYQDNCSISSIMNKYNYTEREAVDRQNLFIDRMLNTLEKNGFIKKQHKTQFAEYDYKTRRLTEKTYRRYKHIIDPDNKRGLEYHLDHKYSVFQGFIDGIEESVIASLYNLEIINALENLKKHKKTSITAQELFKNNIK